MRWEAILLAAGKLEKDFSEFGDLPSKAYLPISGKRMVEYPLEVLESIASEGLKRKVYLPFEAERDTSFPAKPENAIPSLRRIVAVIPEGAPEFAKTVSVTGGDSIVRSVAAGFQSLLADTEMALVVTCDVPCLSREGVEDFMRQCEGAAAGLCYGYVSRHDSEREFPGIPHTYVRTVEGEFCGGGLFGIFPSCFPLLRSLAERAARDRKNIFKLTAALGPSIIIKYLTKRLSIRDVERRLSELLGFPAKGIPSRFPEIAFNVDDSKTLALARTFLEKKIRI